MTMPIRRSPSRASLTIARYRGSKMCSGSSAAGKSTTLGSGNNGSSVGSMSSVVSRLVDRPRLLVHVVHQDVLAQRIRRREIGLSAADFRDAANEGDQLVVAGEHERVDHDAAFAAGGHFRDRFRDDERIEPEGV